MSVLLDAACAQRCCSVSTRTNSVLYSLRLFALTHPSLPPRQSAAPPLCRGHFLPPANAFPRARARATALLLALLLSLGSRSARHLRPPQQPRPSARGRVCRRKDPCPGPLPELLTRRTPLLSTQLNCAMPSLPHHPTASSLPHPRFQRAGSRDALFARSLPAAPGNLALRRRQSARRRHRGLPRGTRQRQSALLEAVLFPLVE